MRLAAPRRVEVGTLTGTGADTIRRKLLADLNLLCGADLAFGFDLRPTDDGPRMAHFTATGAERLDAFEATYEGSRWPDNGVWDPARQDPRQHGRFLGLVRHGLLRTEAARTSWRTSYAPLGATDQARTLLYHDGRFLGFVAVLSRGPAFSWRRLATLSAHHDRLLAAWRTAQHEADGLEAPADIVLRPTGEVEHACARAAAWLSHPRAAWLARCVTDAEQRRTPETRYAYGVRLRLVRLDRVGGSGGVRYLAHLEGLAPFRTAPEAALTPRQQLVARHAAAGATLPEIARALGLSVDTARTHLRAVYDRLGVASRVELAAALADPPPAPQHVP